MENKNFLTDIAVAMKQVGLEADALPLFKPESVFTNAQFQLTTENSDKLNGLPHMGLCSPAVAGLHLHVIDAESLVVIIRKQHIVFQFSLISQNRIQL